MHLNRVFGRFCTGASRKISLITGDGASPLITKRLLDVFAAAKVKLDFEVLKVGGMDAMDPKVMNQVVESIKRNKVALKGSWFSNKPEINISPNMSLRRKLDLWANVIRVTNYPSISSRADINYVVVRQNTEGEYSSIEHEHTDSGVVEMFKVTTKENCRKIAEFAFELAQKENRGTVHCIHKANIMKLGDGLFMNECSEVAKKYENINFIKMIVDNCSMQLVQFPQQFSVIVAPNLYGNIIASISSGLVGSNGVLAGANYSSGKELAVFEPGTRSGSDYDIRHEYANPMAMLHASCEMLSHIGLETQSKKIKDAIKIVVTCDISKTPDIGGTDKTDKFIDAIIYELENHLKD